MVLRLRGSRIRVLREAGRTCIVVRPPLEPLRLLLAVFLLLVAVHFGPMAVRALLGRLPVLFQVVVGGMLVLCIVAPLLHAMPALYGLFGREEIHVGGGTLRVRHRIGPLARTRDFDLGAVTNVRDAPSRPDGGIDQLGFSAGPPDAVAFDYGARTVRIGTGLNAADRAAVLELLRASSPEQRAAS